MKSNGEASGGSTSGSRAGQTTQPRSDIYKQLINNDMVKELDDIEAISQQIFQHAEVLHNSWKHNGMSQGPQFKLSAAQQVSPSVEQHSVNPLSLNLRERGGFLSPATPPPSSAQSNGYSSLKQPSHYTRQAGYSDTGNNSYNSWPRGGPGHESQSSSVSSPGSSTRESPARGSSVTQINNNSEAVGPLELLASPNLNGNLEDLVSSFVSTDRAKQAARNTISSTLMRRIGSPTNGSSPSASPGPTSPTATLNYRGASPLRSPMLTSSAPMSSPFSGGDNDVHTPMQSIFSSSRSPSTAPSSSSSSSSSNSMRTPPSHISSPLANKPMQSKNDIHSPMQSMFSHSSKPSSNFNNGHSSKLAPLHINTDKDKPDGSIPIPVKHIPINKAPAISSSAAAPPADALKSPSVLQSASSSAKQNPFLPTTSQSMSRPGTDQHAPMPNLFDEFGAVNDAKFLEMRRRFEEAKQRMALSLPAREGGVRPNSFGSMALWDSPWGEDSSAFLLEQFRRRNKRRMEMPSAPHPELTPEQKQHISDRSSSLMQAGTPLRRMYPGGRPGGSVAERVLMFEKSPSAFGVEPVQVRVPQRREPQLTGHIISGTPWKSSLQESAVNKVQVRKYFAGDTKMLMIKQSMALSLLMKSLVLLKKINI